MKNIFIIAVVTMFFTSCISENKKTTQAELKNVHKVIVKEVLQANAYTYLYVAENNAEQWIAVPKMNAKVGNVYYYNEFMEMFGFKSKDLNRTFESIYFIQELRTGPKADVHGQEVAHKAMGMENMPTDSHKGKPDVANKEVEIEPAKGGITIEELFLNKEKYNGKKVVVRGVIAKANYEIMNKNWFHIQDGTSYNDNYDLTITSLEGNIKVNDVVTFEGTIILNKDFGYGYFYEVLMADGVIKN